MDEKTLLEAIGQLLDERDKRLSDMMDTKLEPINARLDTIDQRTTKIEFVLEHDVSKQLKLLGEGQQMVIDKFKRLDQVAEDVEDVKDTVNALEAITKTNTTQIKELRLIK